MADCRRIYLARDRDGALDVYWTEPDVDVESGRWMEPVTQASLDAEQLLEELVPEMHCREFRIVPVRSDARGSRSWKRFAAELVAGMVFILALSVVRFAAGFEIAVLAALAGLLGLFAVRRDGS